MVRAAIGLCRVISGEVTIVRNGHWHRRPERTVELRSLGDCDEYMIVGTGPHAQQLTKAYLKSEATATLTLLFDHRIKFSMNLPREADKGTGVINQCSGTIAELELVEYIMSFMI